jgi:putative transcriptional regulator
MSDKSADRGHREEKAMPDKNLRIKSARVAKDMSQADLAEKTGVTRQTIGLIETGKFNPSIQLCISICKALDKTLDELFWEE